jgi:ABC-type branched-subunit amino acid transport system substrate-binding protein
VLRTRRSVPDPAVRALACLAVVACLLGGCAAAPSQGPSSSPTPTATTAAPPPGDGTLTIGTLFPVTGSQAFIAPAQVAGVNVAVKEVNDAGGVLGKSIVVVHGNSGEAKEKKLEASFQSLVEKKVDVIVGPSSSVLAERILPAAIEAQVPLISPAAIAPRLTALDDDDMLFRTISSAAMQGTVLAELASAGKQARLAVIYFDDDTGRATAATTTAAAHEMGGKLVVSEKFTAKTKSVTAIVAAVKASTPDAVILASPFSAMKQNQAMIKALTAAGLGKEKLWLVASNLADYSQALPGGMLTGARGVIEGVEPSKAFKARIKAAGKKVTDYRYAAEAYDAVMLAALATLIADNDHGAAVAASLRDASAGGIKCLSFSECVSALDTIDDIDFDGVSGPVNLTADGDPDLAHFGVYKYNSKNKFARVDGVVAG